MLTYAREFLAFREIDTFKRCFWVLRKHPGRTRKANIEAQDAGIRIRNDLMESAADAATNIVDLGFHERRVDSTVELRTSDHLTVNQTVDIILTGSNSSVVHSPMRRGEFETEPGSRARPMCCVR